MIPRSASGWYSLIFSMMSLTRINLIHSLLDSSHRHQLYYPGYRIPQLIIIATHHPVSSIQNPASGIQYPASSIQHPASSIVCVHRFKVHSSKLFLFTDSYKYNRSAYCDSVLTNLTGSDFSGFASGFVNQSFRSDLNLSH